SRLSEEKCQLS
ncbi:hypothetical protein JL09_g7039, partial [Pichia kudriavzevii]